MVRNELGSGAGILLSRDGDRVYIATANHVVRQGGEDATAIDVQLKALSPRWLRAKLLPPAGDPELDLAILAVDLPPDSNLDFCALPLHLGGDSTQLRRGDPVYPVGYPGGVLWAMPLAPDHATQVFPSQISFESQFVRVGFSGGALLNKHGEIVGMIAADEPPFGRAVPLRLILDAVRAAGYPVQLSTPEDAAQRPLHLAAKAGDLAAMRRLLDSCADPDAADPSGRTALHEAAVQGSADAIRLLVRAGARLHAWAVIREDAESGREWGTPLHLAAQHGNEEAVKALLAGGEADLKTLWKKDDDERVEQASTALHFAVRHDRGEVADVLLAAGADLNAVDGRENRTPLEMAAAHGSLSAARVLVRRGAPLEVFVRYSGYDGVSPLYIAAQAGQIEMMQLLIELGADVRFTRSGLWPDTPLHAAAAAGQVEAVAFLLAQKAAVDTPGYAGRTPLHEAVEKGTKAVVELLIASGADVNKLSEQNHLPIELALRRKDPGILQALVNGGADMDIELALHRALEREDAASAKILIQSGADISLKDAEGRQPLHVAASEGMTEAVELLLKAGASVNALANNGRAPLHLAAAEGHLAIVDLLLAAKAPIDMRNARGNTALHVAVGNHEQEMVARLLQAGADPNIECTTVQDPEAENTVPNTALNTAVALAALSGTPEMLATLLAAGADPNRKGNAELSPLWLATGGRDAEKKVELLLKAGAKVTAEGGKASPLHGAIANLGDEEAARVLALLLAAGGPVDPKDEKGRTPLHHAADDKNLDAVRMLLSAGANAKAVDDDCGATPLLFVLSPCRFCSENRVLAITQLLVDAGADVNATSTCGERSLLDLAGTSGYASVRKFLLAKGAKSPE